MRVYDENAVCPKCGGLLIRSYHRERGKDWRNLREAIVRTCERCHYKWDEAPLDKEREG